MMAEQRDDDIKLLKDELALIDEINIHWTPTLLTFEALFRLVLESVASQEGEVS